MIIIHDEAGRVQQTLSMYPKGHGKHLQETGVGFVVVLAIPPDAYSAWRVVDGQLVPRPACEAEVSVAGRVISLADVPAGSTVTASIDGTIVQIEDASIEMDEAGPVTIRISPPWPIMEAVYDLEIE
ncbi:hypothetical protein [Mesorhizobium qingshengii]|uniref:Uncharacterized protein n=1 Tax=Mesorhizobium qingshengii TaxID=1165689 RepID=A0A1G5UZI4_9HYPH|nr:hypothetical protein [Mesorhizobium qingshengii]SDA39051.1 hypothetical protein SAMN02927914_00103 [Mesorhizobium qingshengii]